MTKNYIPQGAVQPHHHSTNNHTPFRCDTSGEVPEHETLSLTVCSSGAFRGSVLLGEEEGARATLKQELEASLEVKIEARLRATLADASSEAKITEMIKAQLEELYESRLPPRLLLDSSSISSPESARLEMEIERDRVELDALRVQLSGISKQQHNI